MALPVWTVLMTTLAPVPTTGKVVTVRRESGNAPREEANAVTEHVATFHHSPNTYATARTATTATDVSTTSTTASVTAASMAGALMDTKRMNVSVMTATRVTTVNTRRESLPRPD